MTFTHDMLSNLLLPYRPVSIAYFVLAVFFFMCMWYMIVTDYNKTISQSLAKQLQNCIETQYWIPSRYSPVGYGKRKIQYWLQLFKIYLYSCEKQMAWHLFRPLVVRMSVVSRSYVTPYLRFTHNVQCKQLLVSWILENQSIQVTCMQWERAFRS